VPPDQAGGQFDLGLAGLGRRQRRRRLGRRCAFAPGDVRRHDQRGRPTAGTCGEDRGGRVAARIRRLPDGPDPPGDGPRQGLDVGGQRRVQRDVRARVLADDVDDRRPRTARVVQVGAAVGETRAEVQQRARGSASHPGIAVGRPGHDTLEQGQHAADGPGVVECTDQRHLGSSRVGEQGVDAGLM
jgi:hypothetical protein